MGAAHPTPKNPLPGAGFIKRLKAFAFDYLIICGYIVLLSIGTLGIIKVSTLLGHAVLWPDNPLLGDLLAFLTLVLPVTLYFTFGESSSWQATWGKRKAGIRVVNANGERITWRRAFLRNLIKLLPWQISHTCIFHIQGWPLAPETPTPLVTAGFILVGIIVSIYIGTAVVSKTHRTPYDQASGAYVIAEKA
jgi:uncharacterized RDD family membrane protein YckC